MSNFSFKEFKAMMDGTSEVLQKDKLSPMALKIYANSLERFSNDQLEVALKAHLEGSTGQFFPRIADFIKHAEGHEEKLTVDKIIALGRERATPLGVLIAIKIGSFDLFDNDNPFLLRQRAEQCLLKLPEWRANAENGIYSDHEHSIMMKYRVSALDSFVGGIAKPEGLIAKKIFDDRLRVSQTPKHKFITDQTEDHPALANPNYKALPHVKGEIEKQDLEGMVDSLTNDVKLNTGER